MDMLNGLKRRLDDAYKLPNIPTDRRECEKIMMQLIEFNQLIKLINMEFRESEYMCRFILLNTSESEREVYLDLSYKQSKLFGDIHTRKNNPSFLYGDERYVMDSFHINSVHPAIVSLDIIIKLWSIKFSVEEYIDMMEYIERDIIV
jgi:hypothetical protein